MNDERRELFRISDKALELLVDTGLQTIQDTINAMHEMGVARLPFDTIDVECNVKLIDTLFGSGIATFGQQQVKLKFIGVRTIDNNDGTHNVMLDDCYMSSPNGGMVSALDDSVDKETLMSFYRTCAKVTACLVFLLATTNAEKTREPVKAPPKRHKPGSFQARYSGVTTITGRATSYVSDDEHTGSAPRVTHVRRGHVRNQRHGAGRALQKQVWIAPIIVNATLGDLAPRHSYKV